MVPLALWQSSLLRWMVLVVTFTAVEEWSQWRGPRRDGQVVGFNVPTTWPKQLKKRWQVEVGWGHSSPVVAERKIFVFSRRGDDEVLGCFSPDDGKQLWHVGYPAPYEVNSVAALHGKGPKSTPLVTLGRVFTFGISGILSCWDSKTGHLVWRREFSRLFEKTSPLYGAAASPVVEGERCIVQVGGPDRGALLALDIKNGETLWSCAEDGPSYSSPVVATLDDVRQVVTQTQKSVIGVDLADGKLLWRIAFQTEYDQNIVTPLEHEGSMIFSGINKGVARCRIERKDDEWETDNTWENKEVSLYMSSPVADGETLFGFSHRQKGQLFALDLTTGKTLWTSEGRLGDSACLVRTGKVLWALTSESELIVFRASEKQFEPLAHYRVAETPTWAHPVFISAGVLVKDESKLTLWQFPKKQ